MERRVLTNYAKLYKGIDQMVVSRESVRLRVGFLYLYCIRPFAFNQWLKVVHRSFCKIVVTNLTLCADSEVWSGADAIFQKLCKFEFVKSKMNDEIACWLSSRIKACVVVVRDSTLFSTHLFIEAKEVPV